MSKKVIGYKLNIDGTIPDYVEDGGYLPKDHNDAPNMILLGVSKDGVDTTGTVFEFADEASTLAYVETYLSDSTYTDPVTNEERVFLIADAVSDLFAKLA